MMDNLKKLIAVVIVFTMISGGLLVMVPSIGESREAEALAYPDQIPMFADPELNQLTAADVVLPDFDLGSGDEPLVDNIPLNTTMPFITSATFWDEADEIWYDALNVIDMTKMGEGEHCELWLADDRSFYDPLDPRNFMVDVLQWQIDYMIEEFDNNIYPIMTETFIEAPALNGSAPDMESWQYLFDDDNLTQEDLADWLFPTNDTGKIMIMVFNMIDENWYDGVTTTSYTAGYYWSYIRTLYDRNVMHIDCYDWANRIGSNVSRPYVYESTFAHEYQHLLHDEMDPDEDTWVNEGLSMASEFLCGYGIDMMYVTYYLYWPDNSLTVWGDLPGLILGDYGAVLMFMTYLYDHYGGKPMLQDIFFSELNGIESIDAALLDMGYNRMSFDRVFRDWRLANLFLDQDVGGGLYSYKSFDRGDLYDPWHLGGPWIVDISASYPEPVYHSWFGTTQYIQAYGVDYIVFEGMDLYDQSSIKFTFDGDEYVHAGWQFIENDALVEPPMYDSWWYSGDGDQIDNLLTMDVDLTAPVEGGEYLHWLTITTQWSIEYEWDYGFVQVSSDGGETWTSLDDVGDYCTDEFNPDAMETITANLPGLTGSSGGWVDLTFDLSAYDGQEIMVGFRYMTDWATTEYGWDIAEISVDGSEVALTDLATQAPPEADFMVTIVAYDSLHEVVILDVPVMDLSETATKLMSSTEYAYMIVLVSPNLGPVDYCVDITYRSDILER